MNYRFKSNHFVNIDGWYTQYLVSWLNGDSYSDVISMIDRSATPNYSGQKRWILDDDPITWWNNFSTVNTNLIGKGFTTVYDNTATWLVSNPNQVIGYLSNGVHTTNSMPQTYIRDTLTFVYVNGASFLSWESFNGFSFGVSRAGQGLISDFIFKGGTGGSGHVYEPWSDGMTQDYYTLPAFAMGYSIVDAQYQGIYYNAWQNIVIGDPLTTIAWGKQSLTSNLNWSGTNLVTGEITVPLSLTISLERGSVINFRHNGFISGEGFVESIEDDFTLEIEDWDRSVLRSSEDNHPKLIWGMYPVASPTVVGYNIYRKWDQTYFSLIGSTDASTFHFIDEEVEVYIPIGEDPKNAEYYVKAILYVGPGSEESEPSNTIDYWVEKAGKIKTDTKVEELFYDLEQNYPNPFNPVTTFNYQIQNDGFVTLKVFDILGKEITNLVNENKEAGFYSVEFDASNLPSGVYIYQLSTTEFTQARKMILTK